MAERMAGKTREPLPRISLVGYDLDPDRYRDKRTSNTYSIAGIKQELPSGHFYQEGKLPICRANILNKAIKSKHIVLVLHINSDCHVPDCWVSALDDLKNQYPSTDICLKSQTIATNS